jgi:hypothetical protein
VCAQSDLTLKLTFSPHPGHPPPRADCPTLRGGLGGWPALLYTPHSDSAGHGELNAAWTLRGRGEQAPAGPRPSRARQRPRPAQIWRSAPRSSATRARAVYLHAAAY